MIIDYRIVDDEFGYRHVTHSIGRNMEAITMINQYDDTKYIDVNEVAERCKNTDSIDIVINCLISDKIINTMNEMYYSPILTLYGNKQECFPESIMQKIKTLRINVLGFTAELYGGDAVRTLTDCIDPYSINTTIRVSLTLYELNKLVGQVKFKDGGYIKLDFHNIA